jgi:hypothetical protein
MPKDLGILGPNWQIVSSRTFVEQERAQFLLSCLAEIESSLATILDSSSSFPEVVISITPGALTKHTTIVTCLEQKKTHEKSGVL